MTTGLKRNTESLSEHRRRLASLGFRPITPERERELFPNPDVPILTHDQFDEAMRDWNVKYPRGRKDNLVDVPPKKTTLKAKRGAYSPLKRLKQLVKRTKDANNGKQTQSKQPRMQKCAKDVVPSNRSASVRRNGKATRNVRKRR